MMDRPNIDAIKENIAEYLFANEFVQLGILLAYIEDLEQRIAKAEKVIEAAIPFAKGGIEVFTAPDGQVAMKERDSFALRIALTEWEKE